MTRQHFFFMGLFLLLIAGSLFAQYDQKCLSNIRCNYCIGLKSENPGVVTACLINVLRMYNQYPQDDYTNICNQLDTLSTSGKTEQIRLMAKMINDHYDKKRDLNWMMNYSFEEIYLYFKLLSDSDIREMAYE